LQPEKVQARATLRRTRRVSYTPVEHLINVERRCVVVKFGRRLTAGDIQKYVTCLVANPSFVPDFSEIVDLSRVEDVDLQANDFLMLADQIDPFAPGAKRAFVAQNSVQNHAARMHKVLRPDANIRIFRSYEEAERWVRD